MAEITVKTQKEFDALPAKFGELTYVYIKSDENIRLSVNRRIENAHVEARESSRLAEKIAAKSQPEATSEASATT